MGQTWSVETRALVTSAGTALLSLGQVGHETLLSTENSMGEFHENIFELEQGLAVRRMFALKVVEVAFNMGLVWWTY